MGGVCPSRRNDEVSAVEQGETGASTASTASAPEPKPCPPTVEECPTAAPVEQPPPSQASTEAPRERVPVEQLSDNASQEGKGMLTSDGADGTAIAALPSPPAENVDPVIGAASTDAEAFGQSQATEALVQAVEDENWDEAEKLLSSSQGIDPNARTTDWDYAVLRAAAEGGAEETCRLLLDCKADVNGCDKNNMTAIMGCIVGGDNGHIVSLLLDRKADATMKTDDGFTALAWATRLKRDQSIQILRDAGMTGAATAFS